MGATYDVANNDYTIGLWLLAVTAAVAFLFVLLRLKRERPAGFVRTRRG
jgi:MFS transporter, NNP family, nitrate/nitrite transporter